MFGAKIVTYSNYRSSFDLTLTPARMVLCIFLILLIAVVLFYMGMQFGARNTSQELANTYGSKIQMQRIELSKLNQEHKQLINDSNTRLAVLKSRIDQLNSNVALLGRSMDISEMKSINSTDTVIFPVETELLEKMNYLNRLLDTRSDELEALKSITIKRSLVSELIPDLKPVKAYISSSFGWRKDPIGNDKKIFHEGTDFAGHKGTEILSAASGIVTWSGPFDNYGNVVEIDHGNGHITRYAHNQKNFVRVGERVNKGQLIATMGATGRSTGPHLHYEIIKNGQYKNPLTYLDIN